MVLHQRRRVLSVRRVTGAVPHAQVREDENKKARGQESTASGVTGTKDLGVRELGYRTMFLGCFVEPDTTASSGQEGGNIFVRAGQGCEGWPERRGVRSHGF